MGRIIYLMGKSSTGKDTIFKRIVSEGKIEVIKIIPYTTRPIRFDEKQGVEYFFTDDRGFEELLAQHKIIESREYHTYHGLWRYFTVDDGQIDLEKTNYIIIGTLEAYVQTVAYFGKQNMVPILIELDDGIRLQRALDREKKQNQPKYQELCRRFLADEEDFSEEKILQAGITHRFYNNDLDCCMEDIYSYVTDKRQDAFF